MSYSKYFQIAPKGIKIQEKENSKLIEVQLSGKDFFVFAIITMISGIGLSCLLIMEYDASTSFLDKLLNISPFWGGFGLLSAFLAIVGIVLSHTKVMVEIDSENDLTVSIKKPFGTSQSVTFNHNQANHIYQTQVSNRGSVFYFLHMSSEGGKTFNFPKLTDIRMIWLLYTISELFNQKVEPIGPLNVVADFVSQVNCIETNTPESGSNSGNIPSNEIKVVDEP